MSSWPGWLASPIWEPAAKALLHFLWQGAAVGILAALYFRRAGRESADRRYGVACLCLAAMAIAPVLTFAWFWFVASSSAGAEHREVGADPPSGPAVAARRGRRHGGQPG